MRTPALSTSLGATVSSSKHAYKHNNMDSTYLSMLAFLNTFQVLLQEERATLHLTGLRETRPTPSLETLEGIRLGVEKSGLL